MKRATVRRRGYTKRISSKRDSTASTSWTNAITFQNDRGICTP